MTFDFVHYLLDLLWAQAFALVLSPLKQELGFSGPQSTNISVSGAAAFLSSDSVVR